MSVALNEAQAKTRVNTLVKSTISNENKRKAFGNDVLAHVSNSNLATIIKNYFENKMASSSRRLTNNNRAKVNKILGNSSIPNKKIALNALLKNLNNIQKFKPLKAYINLKLTAPPPLLQIKPGQARLFKNGKPTNIGLNFKRSENRKYLVMSPPGTANKIRLVPTRNGLLRFVLLN
jgi:hypothetical protein